MTDDKHDETQEGDLEIKVKLDHTQEQLDEIAELLGVNKIDRNCLHCWMMAAAHLYLEEKLLKEGAKTGDIDQLLSSIANVTSDMLVMIADGDHDSAQGMLIHLMMVNKIATDEKLRQWQEMHSPSETVTKDVDLSSVEAHGNA